MDTRWLDQDERAAWLVLIAMTELLPSVLDGQLRRDAGVTHYEYFVLAMLSESSEHTLRMTELARRTNATLPRLSHVVRRLEARELVERVPCPGDGRATNARLTAAGWDLVVSAAPGHVSTVRERVLEGLTRDQLSQLVGIGRAVLAGLDPERRLAGLYDREPATAPSFSHRGARQRTDRTRRDG